VVSMMGSGIDSVGNDDASDYVLNFFQNLKVFVVI
jgi:hypothetical protein